MHTGKSTTQHITEEEQFTWMIVHRTCNRNASTRGKSGVCTNLNKEIGCCKQIIANVYLLNRYFVKIDGRILWPKVTNGSKRHETVLYSLEIL